LVSAQQFGYKKLKIGDKEETRNRKQTQSICITYKVSPNLFTLRLLSRKYLLVSAQQFAEKILKIGDKEVINKHKVFALLIRFTPSSLYSYKNPTTF
jgi:hypothetical protein